MFVGTLTASLPPLRLFFEKLLDIVLAKFGARTQYGSHTDNYVLPNVSSAQDIERANTEQLRSDFDDDDSQKEVLPGAITRTLKIVVSVGAAKSEPGHLKNVWS